MTDDKSAKDTARDPEREALGTMRGGIRATAKRAARKVAKKVAKSAGQKKTAKKSTAAGSRTTRKVANSASKTDKSAPAKVPTPAPEATPARTSAARGKAAAAKTAAARTATAASKAAIASETASVGATAASQSAARMPAAAPPPESGPSIESPRPPAAPMHPGASMDSLQEHAGGLGGLLALWGPLIIVGFLVLVFRGGEERESAVATGPDAQSQAATGAPAEAARDLQAGGAGELATGALPSERTPGFPGATHGAAEAFDGGFTMRTSMAGPPAFAGPGAGMRAVGPGRIYPSPPGPYRDPRYRGLPTGESWPAAGASEWLWPAEGREGPRQEDGGDAAAVQWVRCAPPYYWCPAPSSPAW